MLIRKRVKKSDNRTMCKGCVFAIGEKEVSGCAYVMYLDKNVPCTVVDTKGRTQYFIFIRKEVK